MYLSVLTELSPLEVGAFISLILQRMEMKQKELGRLFRAMEPRRA